VIARIWRGWTTPENADAYEDFLRTTMFPSIHEVPGFLGADLLRRDDGDEVAFVTITRFESLESVRAFAGDDYERAVIEPEARRLLAHNDERSDHFEVVLDRA
jgi:antibiotic biosynthesis monooxygenase (ABM) superfamily enzyme